MVENGRSRERYLMWVIGLLITLVVFVFAKQTVSSDIRENTLKISNQEIRQAQVASDVIEIKQLIKDLGEKFDTYMMSE